ncbi:MAG: hypothetical protein M1819_005269 [Sarea resinae]|nr:MAG: hypothetical protein M1819_005269 [Sarea resinae]
MADKGFDGRKRSKSSLALSLLHRDKSKGQMEEEVPNVPVLPKSEAGSSSISLTSQPTNASSTVPLVSAAQSQPIGNMYLARHRSRMSTTVDSSNNLSTSMSSRQDPGPSIGSEKGSSIEQSVRMFRLFETLRKGDTAAINKAIRETSNGSPPLEDEPRPSTGSVGSSFGRAGALEGTSLLHLAVQCAEASVVDYILSIAASKPNAGININARDRDGNTPLHLAAQLGRAPIVRSLLDQKDINDSITNSQGRTPLELARTPEIFQQLQLARSLFLDSKVGEIQSLVANHDYENLEKLLEESRVQTIFDINGAELATDPNTTQSGGTLLHEAARKRDTKLIQLLLLHGADPFRRDRKGKLPQDVTKDDRTRAVLKKSPAAAAAQRGIQEKAILGSTSQAPSGAGPAAEGSMAGKEGREMKGYLKKWTNYTSGYKLRWFVLEDGVLSYYKHQDDAGSACRGAINMKIAKLYMDPQDKQRFEIQGKSSVKYHLKANHVVEAKRWFWALNNAIQWAKDEAREEEKRQTRDFEMLQQAKEEQAEKTGQKEGDETSIGSSRPNRSGLIPGTAVGAPTTSGAWRSSQGFNTAPGSTAGDNDIPDEFYEPSMTATDPGRAFSQMGTATIEGDLDDDDEEYGDDASSREVQPGSKDAFNITAQSAKLQLDLLAQISGALQGERTKNPNMALSHPSVFQALISYEGAVRSLKGLVGDLLKIARDRDAYWQYRLDREQDVRRMWEDSMAKVAREQEELEERIGESEDKRKRTKKALKEALGNAAGSAIGSPQGPKPVQKDPEAVSQALKRVQIDDHGKALLRKPSADAGPMNRRKSIIAELTALSDDSDADEDDEEFFDAVDAGEVEVVDHMPDEPVQELSLWEKKDSEIMPSFRGYEDPVRTRLKMDADDRPKISLWGILKSMIGKDMTKMTLPVSFNEPTSLLQRVAEDMEYTDLLDTAATRTDSSERMLYVAAFAASEYASTTGRVAKPFNPLLGETYEYARPDKGYRFFIEQVSHHPPIGAAWAESAKWDYFGESAVRSKFYGKSFDINPLGTWFLRLRPTTGGEELYTWKKVTSSVVGIITGNPTVDNYGIMEVKNWTTGEVCTLDFKARGWKASSAYRVEGKVMDADGKPRWSVGGRWNDKIYARLTPGYEGTVTPPNASSIRSGEAGSYQAFLVWECHSRPTGIPFNLTPFVLTLNALPDNLRPYLARTDTRLRPDQRAMEDGEYDLAATEKNRVEEKQRATRREREARGEEFVPQWFRKARCEITGEEYWAFTGDYWRMRDEVGRGEGEWRGVEDIF